MFLFCRIDLCGVASRAGELFKGHPNPITGLNRFMPKEYKIILPPEDHPLRTISPSTQTSSRLWTFFEILNIYVVDASISFEPDLQHI